MQKSDFILSKYDDFRFENDIIIVALFEDQLSDSIINFAERVLQVYPQKLEAIAEHLYDDINSFYGIESKDRIISGLNKPTLNVHVWNEKMSGSLVYCEHDFDQVHIITLEFDGILEKFSYVSIDG